MERANLENNFTESKELIVNTTVWQPVALGNLVNVVRGRSYRSIELQDNADTALVTLKSFQRGGGYRPDGLKPYVGRYDTEQIINPGEIIVSQTDISQDGDVIGCPAVVPSYPNYRNLVASLDTAILRNADNKHLDYGFLYYRLLSPDYAHHVKSRSTGTTVLHLPKDALPSFEFLLPPLPEQRRIAHILGTLDDKIALNRQMNETLECMARVLFKSWFVDFDPVRAKMEGRWRLGESLPGLPAELYHLFPERLVSSELGEIPEGWKVKALDEIADFRNGLALQKFRPTKNEERLPVVKIAQLRTGKVKSNEWAKADIPSDCIIDDGDIVFSWSGSLLGQGLVRWASCPQSTLVQSNFKAISQMVLPSLHSIPSTRISNYCFR